MLQATTVAGLKVLSSRQRLQIVTGITKRPLYRREMCIYQATSVLATTASKFFVQQYVIEFAFMLAKVVYNRER